MKLKIVTFCGCLLLILPCIGWAQREPCAPPAYDSLFKRNVYTFVEEQPEYPEGTAALMKYIAKNVTYSADARENGIVTKIYIEFIVEENGTIKDVIPGGYKRKPTYMDEAAAKVIPKMPAWKPGKCNGEAVAVKYVLYISCIKLS